MNRRTSLKTTLLAVFAALIGKTQAAPATGTRLQIIDADGKVLAEFDESTRWRTVRVQVKPEGDSLVGTRYFQARGGPLTLTGDPGGHALDISAYDPDIEFQESEFPRLTLLASSPLGTPIL